jgi:WD40 repeat protein
MHVALALLALTPSQPPIAPAPRERVEWKTELTLRHPRPVVAVAASADRIATADDAGAVRLWDALSGEELQTLLDEKAKAAPVTRLQFSPKGDWLYMVTNDGAAVHACECRKPKQLQVFLSRAFKNPGTVVGVAKGTPRWLTRSPGVYRVATDATGPLGQFEQPFQFGLNIPSGRVTHLDATDDWLVTVAGGVLHGWPADRNQKAWRVTLLGIEPTGVVLSADGEWVAVTGDAGGVRIYNAANGQPRPRPKGHALAAWSCAFSPDGKWLATASEDATARIWEVSTGAELSVLKGHTSSANAVAFTPDGKRVVTASDDKTAHCWARE